MLEFFPGMPVAPKMLIGWRRFSLDTETTHVRPRWAELVGISLAWDDARAWYLPLRAPAGERHLDPAPTLAALKPIFADPAIEKIGQNLKFDVIVLRSAGIELAGVAFDTMVASYLLEAGRGTTISTSWLEPIWDARRAKSRT